MSRSLPPLVEFVNKSSCRQLTSVHALAQVLCLPGAADKRHFQDWLVGRSGGPAMVIWWRSDGDLTGCRLDFCAILLQTEEGAPNLARAVPE